MTRAAGKRTQRDAPPPAIEPETPAGHGIGASSRMQGTPSPIPGGRVHVVNPSTVKQATPTPASPPEVKDLNAHGVTPDTRTAHDRADAERGPNTPSQPHIPTSPTPVIGPVPVPVRVVQDDRQRVLRTSSHRSFAVQPNTGEPTRLTGQDFDRTEVLLLNEDAATPIRIAQSLRDLNNGGGTLLPPATHSYLKLLTQDELYGISGTGSAATISIIQIFEQLW